MKATALVGFVSTIGGKKWRVVAGQVIEVPDGADWVGAGLVAVEDPPNPPEGGTPSKAPAATKKPARKKKGS